MALRYYQREAVDAFLEHWAGGGGNALVDLATGTGKSLVAATLTRQVIEAGGRVGVVTHVRELVRQNFLEMLGLWPQVDAGIYCAGLRKSEGRRPVTFASIQSIWNKTDRLHAWDMMLIDECHLVPAAAHGRYRKFIDAMLAKNPSMRVGGLTATPYRLGEGRLDQGEDALFDRTIYEYSIAQGIADGHLSRLVGKRGGVEIDVSKVKRVGGEFNAAALEREAEEIVETAVEELVDLGRDRHAWLIFGSGVQHAYHIRDLVRSHGVSAETVTGETPAGERDRIVEAFKAGKLRCLSNANVLTTGFNARNVDLVGMMRSTLSTSLYVQMVGRGTRLWPGKDNCLVLDWGGNIRRHGPVDIAAPPERSKGKGVGRAEVGDVLSRTCDGCGLEVDVAAELCPHCGKQFERKFIPKHDAVADGETPVLSSEPAGPKWLPVVDWVAMRHEPRDARPPSLRVEITAGLATYSEWVCLEHDGFAQQKAVNWWSLHGGAMPAPADVDEALDRFDELQRPTGIAVTKDGKYLRITARTFNEIEQREAA